MLYRVPSDLSWRNSTAFVRTTASDTAGKPPRPAPLVNNKPLEYLAIMDDRGMGRDTFGGLPILSP